MLVKANWHRSALRHSPTAVIGMSNNQESVVKATLFRLHILSEELLFLLRLLHQLAWQTFHHRFRRAAQIQR